MELKEAIPSRRAQRRYPGPDLEPAPAATGGGSPSRASVGEVTYTTHFVHPLRRDLIIGILVAAFLNAALALLPEWIGSNQPAAKPKPATLTLEVIDMPKLEPDQPEPVEDSQDQQAAPQDFAPPMLADVPQLVTDTSFVQQLQPPLPDNIKVNQDAVTIPQNATTWAKGIGKVFDISMLDQIPRATVQVSPQYPMEMRRAGISGQVLINFIVDTQGNVLDAVAAASTQTGFEQAAVRAISKWRFTPGRRGGHAVNTRMEIPIVFTLDNAGK